jgi:hypothetical protein
MGLPLRRGSRRRRAARGVAAALALFLAAAALSTWPALRRADDAFLARAEPTRAGDHLQTSWHLWLVGHGLASADSPWRDPYSFRPEADEQVIFGGWLLGLPYWPLEAAFGPVVAWNLIVLGSIALAGLLAWAWLGALGLAPQAALVGGLAYSLAPYLAAQRASGHLLGLIAFLLPLALWAIERQRPWIAAAALAALPLSGQTHLALAAIPLVLAYAFVRRRAVRGALVGTVAALAAGVLVGEVSIDGSISEGGRSLRAINFFSADWQDFLAREPRHDLEQFVFAGWLTPLLAAVGAVLLWRRGRGALAAVLALAVAVPALLAFGTNLPLYELFYDALPPFRYPRVPERLMPVAVLALAALAAVAADKIRRPALVALLAVAVAIDLNVQLFEPAPPPPRYAALPAGRVLELPVFTPERHFGSVYLHAATGAPRERPGGYSTVAPIAADRVARMLRPLNCGRWNEQRARLLRRLGVRTIAVWRDLYGARDPVRCAASAERELRAHGWRPLRPDGPMTLYVTPDTS